MLGPSGAGKPFSGWRDPNQSLGERVVDTGVSADASTVEFGTAVVDGETAVEIVVGGVLVVVVITGLLSPPPHPTAQTRTVTRRSAEP